MEIKCQLDATEVLLQILLLAQHVSGTTMPIIRSSRVLYRLLLPVVFGAVVFKLLVWCGAEGYVLCVLHCTTRVTTYPCYRYCCHNTGIYRRDFKFLNIQ